MIPIVKLTTGADNEIIVNDYDFKVTSETWSEHFDVMYLSTNNYYHFVHGMYNEKGMIVKRKDRDDVRVHYVYFDVWPGIGGTAQVRFFPTNDPSKLDDAMGYPKKEESKEKKVTHKFWKEIIEYLRKVIGAKHKYYTFLKDSLSQMESAEQNEAHYNCKLFCRRFNESMGSEMDETLWKKYEEVMKKLIKFRKDKPNLDAKERARLTELYNDYKRVAMVCPQKDISQFDIKKGVGKLAANAENTYQVLVSCTENLDENLSVINDQLEEVGKLIDGDEVDNEFKFGYEELKKCLMEAKEGTELRIETMKKEMERIKEKVDKYEEILEKNENSSWMEELLKRSGAGCSIM